MAKRPSRRARQDAVFSWVMLPTIAIILLLIMNGVTNYYVLGGIFVICLVIGGIATSYVPDMRRKENKNKNAYTGLSSKKKTPQKNNSSKTQNLQNSNTPLKEHNLLRTDNEILALPFNTLTWREFERLCFLYYKGKGYKVKETKEGADGGIDLIYFDPKNQTNIAVQIKQYSKPVNVNIIRNLDSAKKNYDCILAEIISTSTYTQTAKDEADKRKIVWRDKAWIDLFLLPWREKEAKKRKLA